MPNQKADNNTEYTLTHAHHTAVVSPFGASLRRYFLKTDEGDWNAVWGYHGSSGKRGGQGDVLIPFPGRIKDGTYTFAGQKHELVKNDKDGPNAIHGFLRAQLFETKKLSSSEALFTFSFDATKNPGYPFSLATEVAYSMSESGLGVRFQVTNTGSSPAPAGAGFHPYFCGDRGDLADWKITIPAKSFIELKDLVPTGRVLPVDGTTLDFRSGRKVGDTLYNDCVAHLERDAQNWSTSTLASKNSVRKVSIRMDQNFDYVVVYTGDQIATPDNRKAFAIEPMTCGPDAFNHPDWGLRTLAAGESIRGKFVIKAE